MKGLEDRSVRKRVKLIASLSLACLSLTAAILSYEAFWKGGQDPYFSMINILFTAIYIVSLALSILSLPGIGRCADEGEDGA